MILELLRRWPYRDIYAIAGTKQHCRASIASVSSDGWPFRGPDSLRRAVSRQSARCDGAEGMMSLRRAFRIAGAQTVLASHWKVSDKASSQLMTEFIRRWRSGERRAKAWREAQLSLLRSKEFSNPYFWAAFTLTGQWRQAVRSSAP